MKVVSEVGWAIITMKSEVGWAVRTMMPEVGLIGYLYYDVRSGISCLYKWDELS